MTRNKNTHFMAGFLMVIFIILFLVLMGRFMFIQASGTVQGVSLEKWAKEKRNTTYYLDAERGKIFDSNGMVLAYDRTTYRIYAITDEEYSAHSAEPLHVVDPEITAKKLAPLLDEEESFILKRLNDGIQNDKFPVEFGNAGKELSQKLKDEIEDLNLPGINFESEPVRHYPNGIFASHILGFARKQDSEEDQTNEISGIMGIEKEMNDLLKGEDGFISFQRDYYNRKLLDPEEVVKKPVNGHDIYLTIDQKIQTLLEDVMTDVEQEYNPERITAVIMNAKTGEVIAMSNRPSYDPNNPANVQNWYNDVISTPVEPGSTVKMFTWAAAIDAGVYNGDELFKSGSYQINERIEPIHDHNRGKGWGSITFDEGFQRSSIVAASKLVWEKIGPDTFLEYLKAFDLDKTTNIDLPGEVAGKTLYNWPSEKLTSSFGQGGTMTPIQQMKAATAIANGGKMLQPYIIKKIVDSETGEVVNESLPTVVGEPITEATAEQVLELLDSVVNSKYGTGKVYKLDDYSVIGKTGTAEIPNPNGPGYLSGQGKNIYSFLGMSPKEDPELIMYVSVNQPELRDYELGSVPVSYIFKSVMENSLHYLNISPDQDETETIKTVKIPPLLKQRTSDVEQQLTEQGFDVTVIGDGKKIVSSSATEGEELLINDHIILLTDKPKMPNIVGWSIRDVHKFSSLLDLKLEYSGNGYVTKQSIKKGTELKANDYLAVELKLPGDFLDEKDMIDAGSASEQ